MQAIIERQYKTIYLNAFNSIINNTLEDKQSASKNFTQAIENICSFCSNINAYIFEDLKHVNNTLTRSQNMNIQHNKVNSQIFQNQFLQKFKNQMLISKLFQKQNQLKQSHLAQVNNQFNVIQSQKVTVYSLSYNNIEFSDNNIEFNNSNSLIEIQNDQNNFEQSLENSIDTQNQNNLIPFYQITISTQQRINPFLKQKQYGQSNYFEQGQIYQSQNSQNTIIRTWIQQNTVDYKQIAVNQSKYYFVGKYLIDFLQKQTISEFQQIIKQYRQSNDFEITARNKVLDFLVGLCKIIENKNVSFKSFKISKQSISSIQLGQKIVQFMTKQRMKLIFKASNKFRKDYFQIEPRWKILGYLNRIIKIVI